MKKTLFLALVGAFSLIAILPTNSVNAQSTKRVASPQSVSGVPDTLTFLNMPSKLKSISTSLAKGSGTIAGKIYLEAKSLNDWELLDSLTLADKASNYKTFFFTQTTYLSYRIRYAPTGTPTATLTAGYLRRTDE